MALVEAMSMAIPVFGSDISGINFVLKDFKEYLFEASNSKELSEKIAFFYHQSETERTNMGNDLRTYVLNHFSKEKFIGSHELLYTKLIL